MLSRMIRFFSMGIWEIKIRELSFPKAFSIRFLRVILLASQGFIRDRCQNSAAVLTYYSMLNIIPVIAVVFGVAKGFGLKKLIEKQILQLAEEANWQVEIANQILTFANNLLEHTKGTLVAGVGIILLLWTVISILGKIEESFNIVWEVNKSRTLVRKFSDYMSMMILAPILLVISSSATVMIASQLKIIARQIDLLGIFSPIIFFLLTLLPYVSIWALFTVLYLVMPNTRIPIKSGMLGGIVAGTIFQLVQWGYIKFQIGIVKYGAIYGSFAAIPLFLVWLQLSWMIVLFGAEIAFAIRHHVTFGFHPDFSRISTASKKVLVLRIFHLLVEKFSQGEKPLSANQISEFLRIPIRFVQELLRELIEVNLVAETVAGDKHESAFQPGQTIEHLTIKEVLDIYERRGIPYGPVSQSDKEENISNYLQNISEVVEKAPGNVMIKEI
jgi:membrane protein